MNEEGLPALPTPKLPLPATPRFTAALMLVLEAYLVRFRRLATRTAQFHFALVQPALVGRLGFDLVRHGHAVVEFELLRETFVGLAERSGLSNLGQRFFWVDEVAVH